MGGLLTTLYNAMIIKQLVARHRIKGQRKGVQHRLEDVIFKTLQWPGQEQNQETVSKIYVHWGAHESGKSRAARNAAIRLQDTGKLAILLHGYDLVGQPTMRAWLQLCMGLPQQSNLKDSKQIVLIIDQFDAIGKHYSETEGVVEALREVQTPVLLLVTSWERALDLKTHGCHLLVQEEPGFGRWTEDELSDLFKTYAKEIQEKATPMQLATLAGSPGILFEECFGDDASVSKEGDPPKPQSLTRAKLIDEEWRNGIRALSGEEMQQGVAGRFPDKDGIFHWDKPLALGQV